MRCPSALKNSRFFEADSVGKAKDAFFHGQPWMDAKNLDEMSGCLVQDVAKAGSEGAAKTSRGEPGGEGQDGFAGRRSTADARRVRESFCTRIGAERHGVWFGESADIEVVREGSEAACVTIRIGSAFTHEWLRKTFHRDFAAAVREACGKSATVVWEPAAAPSEGCQAATDAVADRQGAAPAPQPRKPRTGSPAVSRQVPAEAPAERSPAPPAASRPSATPAAPQVAGSRQASRLDAFVVGPSNRMAFAAVELAASRPGEMSPLVLHGPSGVGKTHLLEGICTHFRETHPKATAVFLSAEQFTTSFLQSLHGSGLPGFRRTCRSADLLVIDDLQFFVGKRATIMELLHTIDALHRQGRQMVFASDREPEALADLGPDLLSRLRGGMSARMLPPDEEVRRGIVAAIAARRGLAIPEEVGRYIAAHMVRHTRELAGAINRLEATSHMLGLPITLAMAEESLADLVRSSGRSVRLADIERAVCSAFGIESGSLQSAHRGKRVNHPRMLAMFLARKHTPAALTEIGSYFGRRSHSTVISAQKAVGEWVSKRSQIVLADSTWDVEEAIRRVEEMLRAG